jgi:hypothetical protein
MHNLLHCAPRFHWKISKTNATFNLLLLFVPGRVHYFLYRDAFLPALSLRATRCITLPILVTMIVINNIALMIFKALLLPLQPLQPLLLFPGIPTVA